MNTWSRNSFSTSQEQIQHLHSVKMRRHFPTSPWNTKLGEHIATRNVGGGEGIWVIFRVWFFFPHHVILITSKQQSRTRTGMIASGANTDLSLPLFLYSLCLSLSLFPPTAPDASSTSAPQCHCFQGPGSPSQLCQAMSHTTWRKRPPAILWAFFHSFPSSKSRSNILIRACSAHCLDKLLLQQHPGPRLHMGYKRHTSEIWQRASLLTLPRELPA